MSKATISVSVSNFKATTEPEFAEIAQTSMKLLGTLDYVNTRPAKIHNRTSIGTKLILTYESEQSYELLKNNMKSLHDELKAKGKFNSDTQVVFSVIRHVDLKEQEDMLYKRTDSVIVYVDHENITFREINRMLGGYKHGAPTIGTVESLHVGVEVAHRPFDFDLGI